MRLHVSTLLFVPALVMIGVAAPVLTPSAAATTGPAVGTVYVYGRAPGNVVRATGTGFDAGSAVTTTLDGVGISVPLTTSGADDAGTVTVTPRTRLPTSVAPGTFRLTMSETDGPSATSPPFVLVSPVAFIPGTMSAGQPASQFPGGTPIQLEGLSDGSGVSRTVSVDGLQVDTDWHGADQTIRGANVGFAVPADTRVGDHQVTFTQTGPTPYTVTRTVRVLPPTVHIEGNPTSSKSRLAVSVFDSGWDDIVDLQIVGAAGDVHSSTVTGDDSDVGAGITLPGVSAGVASITSVSRHNGATATSTFTVDPTTISAPTGLAPGRRVVNAEGDVQLVMQTDGNLVLYEYDRALWNTHTSKHPGARLALQSDGNAVVYDVSGKALWNSGTSGIAPELG